MTKEKMKERLALIENEINKLQKEKKSLECKIDKRKEDYLKVTKLFIVDGVIENKQVTYSRGLTGYSFRFEDFLYHCAQIETWNGDGSTYLDELISKYSKKFGISEDMKNQYMDRYWFKKGKTYTDMIESYTDKKLNEIYPTEIDFVKYKLLNLYQHFFGLPKEIRSGFFYMLIAGGNGNTVEDFEDEINATPTFIKELVDNNMFKK